MTVVDFHTHLFPSGAMDAACIKPLAERGLLHERADEITGEQLIDPESLVRLYRSQGIDYAVVLAEVTPLTTGVSSNEFVGEFCTGVEELVPFCSPNPYLDRDLAGFVGRLIDRYGFRGIKVYPSYLPISPDDSRLYPLYGLAQEAGLPVMFHTGVSVFPGSRLKYAHPLLLDDVAVDFPELRIVLAHGGRDLWFAEAFTLARSHEHVYLEVSGLPPQRLLDYFPRFTTLAGKVIFGSDFPVVRDLAANIAAVRRLQLPDGFADDMLGATALDLLGIVP
ncbi:MAG: amidohydrolase family protein [Acidimicrobiales bacterium]